MNDILRSPLQRQILEAARGLNEPASDLLCLHEHERRRGRIRRRKADEQAGLDQGPDRHQTQARFEVRQLRQGQEHLVQ